LCVGFALQITRTTPRRRMILQYEHIFFTDERTFIFVLSRPGLPRMTA